MFWGHLLIPVSKAGPAWWADKELVRAQTGPAWVWLERRCVLRTRPGSSEEASWARRRRRRRWS